MTTEERTARLAGAIGHMATKADIETARGEIAGLRREFGKLPATLTRRMTLGARDPGARARGTVTVPAPRLIPPAGFPCAQQRLPGAWWPALSLLSPTGHSYGCETEALRPSGKERL